MCQSVFSSIAAALDRLAHRSRPKSRNAAAVERTPTFNSFTAASRVEFATYCARNCVSLDRQRRPRPEEDDDDEDTVQQDEELERPALKRHKWIPFDGKEQEDDDDPPLEYEPNDQGKRAIAEACVEEDCGGGNGRKRRR